MKKGFPYLVIAILIAVIIWLTKCNGDTIVTKIDTQTTIKYKWDTFTKKETVYKPKWEKIYLTDTIHDSIPVYQILPFVLTRDSIIIKNDSTEIKVKYEIVSENPLYKIDKSIPLVFYSGLGIYFSNNSITVTFSKPNDYSN
jgi:hypothetical protein